MCYKCMQNVIQHHLFRFLFVQLISLPDIHNLILLIITASLSRTTLYTTANCSMQTLRLPQCDSHSCHFALVCKPCSTNGGNRTRATIKIRQCQATEILRILNRLEAPCICWLFGLLNQLPWSFLQTALVHLLLLLQHGTKIHIFHMISPSLLPLFSLAIWNTQTRYWSGICMFSLSQTCRKWRTAGDQ